MQFGMFFFFLLSAYGAATENACPPTEIVKFAELYANPHLHPCQKVSAGFSLIPPKGYPTEQQVKAMCASDECRALIKDVLALKPADCYLSFADVKLNAYKMAGSFEGDCKVDIDKHEDAKYKPTPKPTKKHESYSTAKPRDIKGNSTLEEPLIVKDDHDDKRCPTHYAGKENAKDADNLKPPMNGTAAELFPTPNTTYKASPKV
ncbi:Elicitin-like protein [Phytophthora palmivora]|uniref:Elicitin-like protein n=1 Tax=Phytophthora palmivora TaxID=4796 RepID=A0A2P4WYG4_9STRA|nr:Elicitin-like protein [Phytophthora palmivora]